jgi:hypothetical protein
VRKSVLDFRLPFIRINCNDAAQKPLPLVCLPAMINLFVTLRHRLCRVWWNYRWLSQLDFALIS